MRSNTEVSLRNDHIPEAAINVFLLAQLLFCLHSYYLYLRSEAIAFPNANTDAI